ncbi:MAG: ABC transporter ATP-binding protein [Parvibaculum sp.]|uniref:ABC transporter ATP-binding protein n=1 Tax=Parvibaculum sp. TaxID=2024848 RepID=UPI003C77D088
MSGVSVELSSVTKTYDGVAAVEGVDLVLRAGECVALAGHNGAGKSTLIKLMLGLIRPDAGQIRVLGEDPASRAAAHVRMDVGYLPENIAFHPAMTGIETLAFYARLKRQPLADNARLLERVGISQAARRRVGTYSKGMRQRLGLAQALLGRPRVLFLDEPTTGLDPALRQGFYDILRELREEGACILLSSHALAELEGRVDRVVIMNRGRKVADGTMSDLRRAAGLPLRIELRLGAKAAAEAARLPAGWSRIGEARYELRCKETEKIAAIRALSELPCSVEDIELHQPGLDDMYAHFLTREDA